MAKMRVTVCDVCEEVGRPTRAYRIQRDDKAAVSVDLCSRHAAPLEAFLTKGREEEAGEESAPPSTEQRAVPIRRRRGPSIAVTAMDEIERQKKDKDKDKE